MRGRPSGQKNRPGHNAGRKKRPVVMERNQRTLTNMRQLASHQSGAAADNSPEGRAMPERQTSPMSDTQQEERQVQGSGQLMQELEYESQNVGNDNILLEQELTERRINIDEDSDDEDLPDMTEEDENEPNIPLHSELHEYFKSIQARVSAEKTPHEYKDGTLWVEPPSPFFILRRQLDPAKLYHPRVFLWMPHLLIDMQRLKCPYCKSSTNQSGNLKSHGWNSDPCARRVVDLDR
jgi:hypothetical protein